MVAQLSALKCRMDFRALDDIADRSKVAIFFAGAADYVMLETGQPPNAATVDEFFAERPPTVKPEDALHFGAFEDDHLLGIVGFLFGYPEPKDCYIGLMLMSPSVRGMGIGARVLHLVTSRARARGADRQLVAVINANAKGRAFWEREGFVLEKTFPSSDGSHIRHRLMRDI